MMTRTACSAVCKSCLHAVAGSAVPAGVAVLYLLVVADPLGAQQWSSCSGSSVCYNGGNVGIGTTTPGSSVYMLNGLTINGNGSTMLSVQNGGNNAFALNAGTDGSWTLYDNASGSWAASITSTRGFVGIGTTAPTNPLHRIHRHSTRQLARPTRSATATTWRAR